MKDIKVLFIFLHALLASACTNQDVYNALQQNQQQLCHKQIPPAYQACLEQQSESYNEYRRKRQKVLNKPLLKDQIK